MNILLPGAGLPWIGLHWPYLILLLSTNLFGGPVARLLYGTAPTWGFNVYLGIMAVLILAFPRLYDHQFPKGQPARPLPP